MIEETLLNHLASKLSVPVRMEIPQKPPVSFVTLEKTGSGSKNKIKEATFAIQSHADTLLAAAQLNENVKAVMDGFAELDEVCRCKLNTDYNFTDTSTKTYRYQAVYDITHY